MDILASVPQHTWRGYFIADEPLVYGALIPGVELLTVVAAEVIATMLSERHVSVVPFKCFLVMLRTQLEYIIIRPF